MFSVKLSDMKKKPPCYVMKKPNIDQSKQQNMTKQKEIIGDF